MNLPTNEVAILTQGSDGTIGGGALHRLPIFQDELTGGKYVIRFGAALWLDEIPEREWRRELAVPANSKLSLTGEL